MSEAPYSFPDRPAIPPPPPVPRIGVDVEDMQLELQRAAWGKRFERFAYMLLMLVCLVIGAGVATTCAGCAAWNRSAMTYEIHRNEVLDYGDAATDKIAEAVGVYMTGIEAPTADDSAWLSDQLQHLTNARRLLSTARSAAEHDQPMQLAEALRGFVYELEQVVTALKMRGAWVPGEATTFLEYLRHIAEDLS